MIRIERGPEVAPGIFEYSIPSLRLFGRSRQPLLDACRQIKATGASTGERAGIFREGRTEPDMSCPVEVGARFTVKERASGGIRFETFEEVDPSVFKASRAENHLFPETEEPTR
jgi:hypothetical protein